MFYYYFIIALQVYCFYHIYKNRNPFYWYLVILFVPLIGSVIYSFQYVYNKRNTRKIQSEITHVINPTKRINDLEKRLEFSDTYTNRVALADAYFKNEDYKNAIINYKKLLEDIIQDNLYAHQQLIVCYFKVKDYLGVLEHAEKILSKPEFKGSKQQFCYGMALSELGKTEKAKEQLEQINRPYSNYSERLELAKFYLEHNGSNDGKALLEEIYEESKYMTKPNRRIYNTTITEVERLLKTL